MIPLSKWHQIYSEVSLYSGEARFQILRRFLEPFPRYESAKFRKNFFVFSSYSSSFRILSVNRYNSRMHASICLKFGTRTGGLNSNDSIKFGINPINIRGFTSNFTHLTKSNFCQAYRLNCFEEQAENRYIARLNIR